MWCVAFNVSEERLDVLADVMVACPFLEAMG